MERIMKNSKFLIIFAIIATLMISAEILAQEATEALDFDNYFIDKTMRVDFSMSGNAKEQIITLDKIYQQGRWAGNPSKTVDDLNLGGYYVKIYDVATNRLVFSKGFNCVFFEYRTTEPALKGEKKTYHESALIPYPQRPILFVIESRDKLNVLHPIFIERIDPANDSIVQSNPSPEDKVFEIMINGDCHDKVDFLFLAEGYTAEETDKFKADAERFTKILFETEPYKDYKTKFNVRAVMRASAESGVDEPTRDSYRDTVMDASANALGTPRYMLIYNNKAMQDIAAAVPYDAILIAANTDRYTNGGIYNSYCIFAADNNRAAGICPHEFAHSFAGLADEYYGADVAYSEFYPRGVEPLEPNITALLNPKELKWKHLVEPGTPIPTEPDPNNPDMVGAFEGAGYTAKGLYRSQNRCRMGSGRTFCKACQEGIIRVINHLSNE